MMTADDNDVLTAVMIHDKFTIITAVRTLINTNENDEFGIIEF